MAGVASNAEMYIPQLSGSARSPYAAGGREDEIILWRIETMQRSTTFGNVAEGGTFDFIGISTNHGFPNLDGIHKLEIELQWHSLWGVPFDN